MTNTKVKIRQLSALDLVKRAEQEDYNKKEVVYRFSNNREFKSTDNTGSGIYERQS